MPSKKTHDPPETERASRDISWDDVRIFVVVAAAGSLRAASAQTGLSVNAIRRRLETLEQETGSVLFVRSTKGMELTADGEKVRAAGEAMLQQASVFKRLSGSKRTGLRSAVRVGVTEGLGAFWLVPRVLELCTAEPTIQVQLRCEMNAPNIAALEVDLAVQLERPMAPELIVSRLGWLHICLFASEEYVAKYGAPATPAEVPQHAFIELVADQIASGKLEETVPNADKRAFVGLRVNTSSAQVLAALHGAGVTALPSYARRLTPNLVHVAPGVHFARDIWLAYHPRAAELPHVRKTIAWIKRAFDQDRYPWFREAYVPPAEILPLARERDDLFASFGSAKLI